MVYRAAPLDRLARIVTRLMWAGGGVSLAAGAWLAASDDGGGWILILVGALLVAMTGYLWRLQPLEYLVEEGAFAVRRRSAAPKHFSGALSGARPGALGMRIAGDGGVYGYLGRYRAEGRTVHAFVTDRTKVALLDVGETSLAVSPGDRDQFLVEVGRGT
jgi:hypothetical protein